MGVWNNRRMTASGAGDVLYPHSELWLKGQVKVEVYSRALAVTVELPEPALLPVGWLARQYHQPQGCTQRPSRSS